MERYYSVRPTIQRPRKRRLKPIIIGLVLLVAAIAAYKLFAPTPVERAVNRLNFDDSVTEADKQTITQAIKDQNKAFSGSLDVKVKTVFEADQPSLVLSVYLPVTSFNSAKQTIAKDGFAKQTIKVASEIDDKVKAGFATLLGIEPTKLTALEGSPDQVGDDEIALIPTDKLLFNSKLLRIDDAYYLDSFKSGAIFRIVEFTGESATTLNDLKLNNLPNKESVFKVNMTGVTALTRRMLRTLNSNGNPLYFSEKIGEFLADADLTHVSNEVSFKQGCTYHDAVFCSDPRFIETLKASGVDLVELTGNHNNDVGASYNTETINLYHSLGWKTYGGGLNTVEAAKPVQVDQKGSKVAFLAYNYPDSPNGGAISGTAKAGANGFDFDRIKSEIESAKQSSQFVVVNVQFWECYSYPDGYVEFPQCDSPIPNQAPTFQKIIDLGADMVIGSSAHQPQTYELYKGKPIYYGLGNLYFEQIEWPGTERGIILTHYFINGKLVQTKLSPTVYDDDLQTRLMTNKEADYLLGRLKAAR